MFIINNLNNINRRSNLILTDFISYYKINKRDREFNKLYHKTIDGCKIRS